jgi:hypothetical protein
MKDELSLKSKLNVIRLELSKEMNKSGKNDYSHYEYFQLKDFMPQAIELCNEYGLFTKFWMGYEKIDLPSTKTTKKTKDNNTGIEVEETIEETNFEQKEFAYLEITNLSNEEEVMIFKKETADVRLQAAQAIQNLGGKNTYMKRYMYMDVFEINENDKVEEETGKPEKVETKKATAKSKPAVKSVSTKKEEPKEETFIKDVVEPTDTEINIDELMTMDHKVELANYMKEKGLEPKATILEAAKSLGTDVPFLKESDFEKVKKYVDSK